MGEWEPTTFRGKSTPMSRAVVASTTLTRAGVL